MNNRTVALLNACLCLGGVFMLLLMIDGGVLDLDSPAMATLGELRSQAVEMFYRKAARTLVAALYLIIAIGLLNLALFLFSKRERVSPVRAMLAGGDELPVATPADEQEVADVVTQVRKARRGRKGAA